MTRRFLSGAVLAGVAVLLTFFQNCSGGDLPPDALSVTQQSVTPLKLGVPNSAMGPSSTMGLTASGGTPPYTFSVTGGPVTVDANSGLVTSTADFGTVYVRVTDSVGAKDDGNFAVDASLAPVIAGTLELATAGTSAWVIKPFNTLTIEVWGAGASGGGVLNFGGRDGEDGGASSVVGGAITLTVQGGKKGLACAINTVSPAYTSQVHVGAAGAGGAQPNANGVAGNAASAPTLWPFAMSSGGGSPNGGAGGTPSNSSDFLASRNGVAPGGGGGGAGFTNPYTDKCVSGGGGGGAYVKLTYARESLNVGATLNLTVGAGPAVYNDPQWGKFAGDGAPGKIKIVWN